MQTRCLWCLSSQMRKHRFRALLYSSMRATSHKRVYLWFSVRRRKIELLCIIKTKETNKAPVSFLNPKTSSCSFLHKEWENSSWSANSCFTQRSIRRLIVLQWWQKVTKTSYNLPIWNMICPLYLDHGVCFAGLHLVLKNHKKHRAPVRNENETI